MPLLSEGTRTNLEKKFRVVTGNHFVNYLYGSVLSKTLKVLPVRDFNAQEIVPNLFLGDVYAAHNTKALKEHNITHILTCTVGVAPPFPKNFQYLQLKVLDCPSETIYEHFPETSNFIAKALEGGGRVLVHCIRGVSRSATIVCAYLMTAYKIPPIEAVKMVRAKRPIAHPNYGFMTQLEGYGAKILKPGTPLIPIASLPPADRAELIGPDDEDDDEPSGADVILPYYEDDDDDEPTGADVGKEPSADVKGADVEKAPSDVSKQKLITATITT